MHGTDMSPLTAIGSLLAYAPFGRGATTQAYDEETFRHFLNIERRRAEQSARSFLFVVVSLRQDPRGAVPIPVALSDGVFAALERCVREVDFVGWYREGRTIAAVLTQGAEPPASVTRAVADRVTAALASELGGDAVRLNVRVVRLPRGNRC